MEAIYPTIEEVYKTVENALEIIGMEIENSRNAEEGQWSLFRGEQEVYIDAWSSGEEQDWNYYFEEKNVPIVQIIAPICPLPIFDKEEFYAELLRLNLHLFNAAFMVNLEENICCIKQRIPLLNNDPMQIVQLIESVGYYAEFFTPKLKHKFGLK